MPKKRGRKKSSLAKKMRSIAKDETLRLAETKMVGKYGENIQLNHNTTAIRGPFLSTIATGVNDPTSMKNAEARIGNEIYLKEFETRFWLSNKLDRPNVMYRITTFWYPTAGALAPTPDNVYLNAGGTFPNVMILRPNTGVIQVISDKFIFSGNNYAQPYQTQPEPVIIGPGILGREASQLRVIKKYYKNKKVTYEAVSGTGTGQVSAVKGKDIYVAITAYDAWGTLTSDNIASYAVNWSMKFKDL